MNTNPKQSAWKCATYQCKSIVRLDNDHKHTNQKCYTLKNACRRAKLQTKTTTQTKHPKKHMKAWSTWTNHMKSTWKNIWNPTVESLKSFPAQILGFRTMPSCLESFEGTVSATIFIQVSFRGKVAFRWGKRWENIWGTIENWIFIGFCMVLSDCFCVPKPFLIANATYDQGNLDICCSIED